MSETQIDCKFIQNLTKTIQEIVQTSTNADPNNSSLLYVFLQMICGQINKDADPFYLNELTFELFENVNKNCGELNRTVKDLLNKTNEYASYYLNKLMMQIYKSLGLYIHGTRTLFTVNNISDSYYQNYSIEFKKMIDGIKTYKQSDKYKKEATNPDFVNAELVKQFFLQNETGNKSLYKSLKGDFQKVFDGLMALSYLNECVWLNIQISSNSQSKQKYLKYKQKYLELKKQLNK